MSSTFGDEVVAALGFPHYKMTDGSSVELLSRFEPCERCGTKVYGYTGPAGRGVVEPVRFDIPANGGDGWIRGRWHTAERCRDARDNPGQVTLW